MSKNAPPVKKIQSVREVWFEMIDNLCNRFVGLSPFEVMNSDLKDVYELYVDVIIHDRKHKKSTPNEEWVTSKNATWH